MLQNSIETIDTWMQVSSTNYGLYFIIIAIILALGFSAWVLFEKKIGKSDERSDFIKLRAGYVTLGIGWVLTLFFIPLLIDSSIMYTSQLVLIPLTLTVVAGAITNAVYYNKNK